jgi:uncharacterized membrane protein YkoI
MTRTTYFLAFFIAISPLLSKEATPVNRGELPPDAQALLGKYEATGKLESIVRDDAHGDVSYDVRLLRASGESFGFSVDAAGKLTFEDVRLEEVPEAVRKTITAQTGAGKVSRIEKSAGNEEVEYEVSTVDAAGKTGSFTVDADGKISSIEVGLEELPAAVKRTVIEQVGTGKIEAIEKAIDGTSIEYEVEFRDATGRLVEMTVGSDGGLESITIPVDQLSPGAQATVKERVGDGKIVEVRRVLNQGGKGKANGYPAEVHALKNGVPYSFRVGPNGKFQGLIE